MIRLANQGGLQKVFSTTVNYVDSSFNQIVITHNLGKTIHMAIVEFLDGNYPVHWRWDNGGVWGTQLVNANDRMSITLLLGLTGNGNQSNVKVQLLSLD